MTGKPMHAFTSGPRRLTLLRAMAVTAGAVMAAALVAAPVFGQVQVQQGQSLDASNQVGSGGSNNPVPGYVPQNANAYGVMNSGGARLNYQVVPVPLPGGGTSYARIPQLTQSPFVNSQVPPGAAELSRVNAVSAGISSLSASQLVNGQTNYVSATPLGQNALGAATTPVNPAYLSNPWTNDLVSPPTSLPYGDLGSALPAGSLYNFTPGPADGGLITGSSPVSSLFGLRQVRIQEAVNPNATGVLHAAGKGQNGSAVEGNANKPARPNDFIVSSRIHGNRVGSEVKGGGLISRVGQPINSLAGSQVAPNSRPAADLYQRLLAELSSGRKSIITAPGLPGKTAMSLTTLAPTTGTGAQMLTVDPITGLPIAPLNARHARNSIAGGPAGTSHAKGKATKYTAPGTGNLLKAESGLIPNHVVQALQAGQKVHVLNSLVGAAPGEFNKEMAAGQVALKKGKFVRAMDSFQAAMLVNPADPLAIIGRAHAELAAGLYGTAAYDLKFVFQRHAELTAVHYNLRKMLPAITVTAVNKDLAGLLKEKSSTGAFLAAYVAYQNGQPAKVKAILNEWAKWRNGGIWPAILSKAWLGHAPAAHGAKP